MLFCYSKPKEMFVDSSGGLCRSRRFDSKATGMFGFARFGHIWRDRALTPTMGHKIVVNRHIRALDFIWSHQKDLLEQRPKS